MIAAAQADSEIAQLSSSRTHVTIPSRSSRVRHGEIPVVASLTELHQLPIRGSLR